MEIHKENHLLEQFEKTKSFKRFFSTLLRFDEDLDCFVATEKWRDKEAELLTAAWWMFVEVAKHQPVPEGFEQAYSEIFSPIIKQPYPRLENGDYKYIEIDQGWKLWQTAAAQAVPDSPTEKTWDEIHLDPKERLYWSLRSAKKRKSDLNWSHASHQTCVGSTHGRKICEYLGVDPDGKDFVRTQEPAND
ncbi:MULTISPECIES: hypothetical protein [Acinetobacter]|uniref:hypothetical protein n=1 Tax=Acinetobacter TaxID=469 RepID=UPI002480A1C4|nr:MULTISPECIES: hypothetical protein [Acinetobacter]